MGAILLFFANLIGEMAGLCLAE
ncbi:hypothetical protein [Brevibacillus sp. SYSU BS000544]